jgi:hypothetical protein
VITLTVLCSWDSVQPLFSTLRRPNSVRLLRDLSTSVAKWREPGFQGLLHYRYVLSAPPLRRPICRPLPRGCMVGIVVWGMRHDDRRRGACTPLPRG